MRICNTCYYDLGEKTCYFGLFPDRSGNCEKWKQRNSQVEKEEE